MSKGYSKKILSLSHHSVNNEKNTLQICFFYIIMKPKDFLFLNDDIPIQKSEKGGLLMLNVYNYYVQDYVSRTTRYTAHKQRELRDIYKSIVKLSAPEPLFKIELSEKKQANALQIKENALSLREVTGSLQNTSLLRSASLVSSDSSAVSAAFLHRMDLNSPELSDSLDVEVLSLAAGQKNTGYRLDSEASPLTPGSYSFRISSGHENYSFRFQVAENSPAFELQSKLADFINKTGIGLTAQVSYNKELSISRMELSADQTGAYGKSSFSLQDTELPEGAKKGIVETLGLDRVTTEAGNARYTVNGTPYESTENTAVYRDLLRLRFHRTTDEPVTVHPVADSLAAYDALESFTSGYNALIQVGKKTLDENKSSAYLLQTLSHLVSANYSALSSAGITADESGYLSLRIPQAENESLPKETEHLFSGDSSFLKSLNDRLDSMILNPMRFVDKKLVIYPNPNTPLSERTSPYTTSHYSGMLFNYYC